jgi:hypothetical protein
MFGHHFHSLVFVGAQSDALPIRKHEPLMGANFLDYVLSHFDARQSVDHITRAEGLPSAGCELVHSGQGASEKLAVNRIEDECQHDGTPVV